MMDSSRSFCGPNSTLHYNATQDFAKAFYFFACVINMTTSVFSVLGNIIILSALRKCISLHAPSKTLLCSLALTDVFVGLVVLPLFITYHLTIILEMSTYYCVVAVVYARTATFISCASLFTIVTIAIDRFLAFRLRLRYRVVVTFKRVVSILASEWILAALWSGSWFWSQRLSMIFGAVTLITCFLVAFLCYLIIHQGLRSQVTQIRPHLNRLDAANDEMAYYRRTVSNMMWVYGFLLICYTPFFSALMAIFILGLTSSTRFAVQFSAIAVYFNSAFNPVLYCWRIKELREKVVANCTTLCNCFLSYQ